MIANYKAMYEFNIDKTSSQYKGPFNTLVSDSHVFTPKDTAVVTPNADTPYSMLQADLRAEPIIFCVPDIEKGRYYSVQLVDMYTFNYGYVGTRTTGNVGGCYMVSGPGWRGVMPAGISSGSRQRRNSACSFTALNSLGRTTSPTSRRSRPDTQSRHFPPTPTSLLLPPAPAIEFPKFTDEAFKTDFPKFLNFLLQFCPDVPEEAATRLQFATIGIGPGKPFDAAQLSDGQKAELDCRCERWLCRDSRSSRRDWDER